MFFGLFSSLNSARTHFAAGTLLDLYFSLFWHFPHYHGSGNRPSSSIRKGSFKLIRWYQDGSEELYNLNTDISEENDLSKVNASKRIELSNELSRWLKSSGAKLPEVNKDN